MVASRREFIVRVGAIVLLATHDAEADTYEYDDLGRLKKVNYTAGGSVEYRYDRAGNRIQVTNPGSPPSPPVFSATIAVTGTAPVDLRSLANLAGYSGTENSNLTFEVANGTTIVGSAGATGTPAGGAGGLAIDTGTWPSGYTTTLTLRVKTGGKVCGGGGGGGSNMGASQPGYAGGVGGDAVYCRAPISIIVESGAEIRSGGGGGGAGGSGVNSVGGGPPTFGNGGGAGGGFPNGRGGSGYISGGNGQTSGGGLPGSGSTSGGAVGGMGGAGGGAGLGGANGVAGTGNQSARPGGTGGATGYAIRKNGNTVTVTNSGTISGPVG